MKWTRYAAAVGILATVGSITAYAAGLFPGFPIVGSPSYCSSSAGVGSGTGSSTFSSTTPGAQFGQGQAGQSGTFANPCSVTVPAGPTALTGNELIPADTGLGSGQQPQTVLIPTVLMGAGGTNYQTPLTGATVAANANESTMLLDPAGTIATLTVTMPGPVASLRDGQTWRLASSQTVTALTLTPATGTTIAAQTPTAITVSTTAPYNYEFIYKASNAKWYRVQ